MPRGSKPPRWSLESIYAGYDDAKYSRDRKKLLTVSRSLIKLVDDDAARKKDPAAWLSGSLKKLEQAYALYLNAKSYIYCNYATDTRDERTVAELNGIEKDVLLLKDAEVRFRNRLADLKKKLPALYTSNKVIGRFRFYIEEQLEFQARQMSETEENLAADLNRSGGDAWGRLQETISSNLTWPWSDTERKTVVELRSLATHKDRDVRQKAYTKELAAWETMEIPLAAALNGVKGFAVTLNSRRGYASSLERAELLSRISDKTLRSMIAVMERGLPVFRRYLRAKAKLIGVPTCAFYDLFAPVGDTERTWSFREAQKFIVTQLETFSPDLSEFATKAFKERWIDALSRAGKVPGAFCTYMPLAKESRVLANFDGSFDSVATLAHELGHAYHGHVMKHLSTLHQDYPMTLAETASIFSETLVFNQALKGAASDLERIGILELFLQGATQVIVDILSRYKFENAVFERRKTGELSPAEFSELMRRAQLDTYGNGIDRKQLHKYMWAVKGHYYSVDLSFYNYPYAFGQLLGLALYAAYEAEPGSFPDRYRSLLERTGQASANQVTKEAGFDIESEAFWQSGINIIAARVKEFEKLAAQQPA